MTSTDYIIEHFTKGLLCSYAKTNSLAAPKYHMHNFYELNLFIKGDIVFFIDDQLITPKKGSLFLIDNTQIHGPRYNSSQEYERAIIHFDPQLAYSLSSSTTNLLNCFRDSSLKEINYVTLNENQINLFIQLTQKIEALENDQSYGSDLLKNAYLIEILVMINNSLTTNSTTIDSVLHSNIVEAIIKYINVNLYKQITLTNIEKELAMNRQHLNREFKKEIGLPIIQYAQLKKISLAKKMLLEGCSPKNIAADLGYKDYSTFSRAFKKIVNESPNSYIKTLNY